MDISVILCTYNRCESLRRALASIAGSESSESLKWEVLIVDNNSQDQTYELAQEFCHVHPDRFRYVFEERPGKSNALNTGVREAKGRVLAFMDDDVIVEPAWLFNLTYPLINESWAGSGGPILPEWTGAPPAWLPDDKRLLTPLPLFDLGAATRLMEEPPFGTNMAFQASMFEKYGMFRTDLGPTPFSEVRSEDTEFGLRLLKGGEKFRYVPSAVVYHRVEPNRLRKSYFLRWWRDKGRADVRQYGIEGEKQWCVGGIPVVLFRRIVSWTFRWLVRLNSSKRFEAKLQLWGNVGRVLEAFRLRKVGEAYPDASKIESKLIRGR